MRKFLLTEKSTNVPVGILFLVVERNPINKKRNRYRFVNIDTSFILDETFRNPAEALNWLDTLGFDWYDITDRRDYV